MPAVLKRPAAAAPAAPAAKKGKQAAKAPTKPPAKEVGEKPAKKAKQPAPPKRDPLLTQVAAGLELAADLPQSAKEMINDMLVHACSTWKAERHEFQASVVSFTETTLTGVERGLQEALEAAQQAAAHLDETKDARANAVQGAEKALEEQRADVSKAKHSLADAARAFRAAREAIAQASAAQETVERDLTKAAADKDELEVAMADLFRPLLAEGGAAGEGKGQEKADSLMQFLTKVSFDEAMLSALPSALVKEPSTRGSFEMVVLSQLESDVAKRVAELDASLKEAQPTRAQRAEDLEKAQASLEEAKQAQLDGAGTLQAATAEEQRRQAALQEAKQAVAEAGKEAKRLGRDVERSQRALDSFVGGPLVAFLQLRDRSAPAPVEEEAAKAEEAPAADANADTAGCEAGAPEAAAMEAEKTED